MPELPEVETVRRGLNQLTLGRKITGGEVLLPRTLAHPFSLVEFDRGIAARAIKCWNRRGKYLLATLDNGSTLAVHLRMTGQLLWVNADTPLAPHTRLRFYFEGAKELRFIDTRTFGKIWWIPAEVAPERVITALQTLGPEPLGHDFTPEAFYSLCRRSRRPIKTFLLDQTVVAGIGNIYADEALFKSGIDPRTLANELTIAQTKNLTNAIIYVLGEAIDRGGTSFSDFLHVTGMNGNYGAVAWVYGRTGEECRVCGTAIDRVKLGGRSSHFCPKCQG
jgi:formamidopyrimidine-DNA glycosylase